MYAGTYSTGVISVAFSSLPHHLRYRTHKLKIHALTPGPTEWNADELQHALKNLVDELIKLYEEGVVIKTPQYPNGGLI